MRPGGSVLSPIVEVKDLGYITFDTRQQILDSINFAVEPGERIGIIGPSGSGKSTLCHFLAGIYRETLTGNVEGEILRQSENAKVGLVLQNPENQIFATKVREEIAFGMAEENPDEVAAALSMVGLEGFEDEDIATLSIGQKQRVMIAAFLAVKPDLLILDEPTNNLDPPTADQLFQVLSRLPQATIVIEHDLDRLAGWADRILAMDDGRVVCDGTVEEVFRSSKQKPRINKLRDAFGQGVKKADPTPKAAGKTVFFAEELCCGYGKKSVLNPLNIGVRRGEVVVLLGRNGSGKTTLLRTFAGVQKPLAGDLYSNGDSIKRLAPEKRFGKTGYVYQNPDYQLFENTVERECSLALRYQKRPKAEIEKTTERWLKDVGLAEYVKRTPYNLSYGEKRRLTLASVMVAAPGVVLLDEPTIALDEANIGILWNIIRRITDAGSAVVLSTHDLDFAFSVGDRFMLLDGEGGCRKVDRNELDAEVLAAIGFNMPETQVVLDEQTSNSDRMGYWDLMSQLEEGGADELA